jgi:hypothetical protein
LWRSNETAEKRRMRQYRQGNAIIISHATTKLFALAGRDCPARCCPGLAAWLVLDATHRRAAIKASFFPENPGQCSHQSPPGSACVQW